MPAGNRTLDCGTMNFSLGDYVMTNTPSMLREMARQMTALGVRPEIEAFDTGHLWFAKQLAEEGLIEDPVLIQLCNGAFRGARRTSQHLHGNGHKRSLELDLFPPSRSAATPWPIPLPQSLPAATSASAWKTISMSARASSRPMPSSWRKAVSVVESMGAKIIGPEESQEAEADEAVTRPLPTLPTREDLTAAAGPPVPPLWGGRSEGIGGALTTF